ncbi:MAG: deoxyribodipyrimidine photo-lyase [Acidimicrobiales bacterium]
MTGTTTVFWFRRDLRLHDNPALREAVRSSNGRVLALFVLDPAFASRAGRTRGVYLARTLHALDQSLGGALVVRRGDPASVLVELARETGARAVVATTDYGPRGRARDARVAGELARAGVSTTYLDSPYAVAPGTVRTAGGSGYLVFGAFKRGWRRELVRAPLDAVGGVSWVRAASVVIDELDELVGRERPEYFGDLPDGPAVDLAPAGEDAAAASLTSFVRRLGDYELARDVPGLDATSRLSPYLRFGALHPRQVLAVLDGDSPSHEKFRDELCWREFYADVLFHHPESAWRTFQPSMRALRVDRGPAAEERFRTWARGQTGYPLVDAGMRQLLDEGWMHNRVRMVAASFLVKHLHLDWRWGAKWFMWRLVDADLASNQHGWQWTAGTGTDAAPFHRIFNPTLQAKRFDPDGTYVHRYVSELRATPPPSCLEPGAGASLLASGYPDAIVDANEERLEALARYAEARAAVTRG